jgi:hypothetical protein
MGGQLLLFAEKSGFLLVTQRSTQSVPPVKIYMSKWEMLMGVIDETNKILTALDRCDRCIAQAYYMVALKSGDLYFCRHHFSKYEDDLMDIALDIYDESDTLETKQEPVLDKA